MTNIERSISQFLSDIRKIVKFITRYSICDGVIESIDEIKFTCSIRIQVHEKPLSTDSIYNNVPLKVLKGLGASFVEIPKVGTRCEMCFRDGNNARPQLLMVHECSKIVFFGGAKGAMPTNQVIDKVNVLENDLNTLKQIFTGWTPVPMDGGAALKTAATTWAGTSITVTNKSDVTSDKMEM